MKKLIAALATLPLALAAPTNAGAATSTMVGSFWVKPDYSTIKTSTGTLAGANLPFTALPTQSGIDSAYEAQGRWLESLPPTTVNGQKHTSVSYSMSTHATVGRLRDEPETLKGVHVILIGAPETPGNPKQGNGHKNTEGLPDGPVDVEVDMVVRQYDPVADAAHNPNFYTWINSKMATHIYGYDHLDLTNPDAVYVDPVTGVKVLYFRSDVLPMLKPWDWALNDERMAELDAKYRPKIEAGYSRPDGIFSPEWEEQQWASNSPTAEGESLPASPARRSSGSPSDSGQLDTEAELSATPATTEERTDDDGADFSPAVDSDGDAGRTDEPDGDHAEEERALESALERADEDDSLGRDQREDSMGESESGGVDGATPDAGDAGADAGDEGDSDGAAE